MSYLNFSIKSRKRVRKNRNQNEPRQKMRKMDSEELKQKICYMFLLPNDTLEKIVSYIPYWHMPRLRRSCKRLLNICNSVLLHEFKAAIFQNSIKNPRGAELYALNAIKDATWPYVCYGCESMFCGAILPIIWNNKAFIPEPDKIKTFLKNFYILANKQCGKPNSQTSRLLYCLTLMRLLKKLKSSSLISSSSSAPNYWRFVLEFRGPWVGVLSSPKLATEPHECAKLLMMLCELIVATNTNRALRYVGPCGGMKVWECDSEIFIFGTNAYEESEHTKRPTMVVTFNMTASKKITSLLKSCLEDEYVELPNRLPRGEFVVSIDVSCKEAAKWGCCQVHRIEIGPHFDANFEDEQED